MSVKFATGHHVILEPLETSTVLKSGQLSTLFKILCVGDLVEAHVTVGDIVFVRPGSVEETIAGRDKVFFVNGGDIVGGATV